MCYLFDFEPPVFREMLSDCNNTYYTSTIVAVSSNALTKGWQPFLTRAILLHLPADMASEEPQNVDGVLFFMHLHRSIGSIAINLILILAKCKF